MGEVIGSVSMSLDGFIAGPDARPGNPLDDGGRLHSWIFNPSAADRQVLDGWDIPAGVVVVGRRMFDEGEEPWGDDPPWHLPVLIVTHHPKPTIEKQGGTSYEFMDGGPEAVLGRARELAGDKDVMIGGGGQTLQAFLRAGLIDELRIHLVPVILGAGRPLFSPADPGRRELEPVEVVSSPNATHLRYRLSRS